MAVGIKETKEAVLGLLAIAPVIAAELKDGASLSDALVVYQKVMASEELKVKVLAAYDNIKAVPEEVKDLDLAEAIDLIKEVIPEVLKLIQVLKA